MSFAPNLFLSNIKAKDGLARPARFEILLPIPVYISEYIGNSVIERLLNLYTKENDTCIDFFAGSGVLGRACKKTNRNYLLIDINENGKIIFDENQNNE